MKVPLYFDALNLGEPSSEYVAWIDVMGMQGILARSVKIAANFSYKLHIAALESPNAEIKLYPIMDGLYACSPSRDALIAFIRSVLRVLTAKFVDETKHGYRFLVRCGVAHGEVYHGCDLNRAASFTLADNPGYRDKLMIGEPIVSAFKGERKAPPFGVFAASGFDDLLEEQQPFDHWRR